MKRYGYLSKKEKVFLTIYFLCFLIATLNHLNDIRIGGWLPYRYAPVYLNVFWTSLLFIDLAVVFLLILRLVYGLYLAIAVILIDLLVNIPYFFFIRDFGAHARLMVLSQIAFALFLMITAPGIIKSVKSRTATNKATYKTSGVGYV